MKLVKTDGNNSDLGWIGRGIEISGDISFSDRLQIEGKVKGRLQSETGTLVIGESGHLEAQIDVGTCIVFGVIHGDLISRNRVEIRRTGRINGDVVTPVLVIEEGAVLNGLIKMGNDAAAEASLTRAEEILKDDKRKLKGA